MKDGVRHLKGTGCAQKADKHFFVREVRKRGGSREKNIDSGSQRTHLQKNRGGKQNSRQRLSILNEVVVGIQSDTNTEVATQEMRGVP